MRVIEAVRRWLPNSVIAIGLALIVGFLLVVAAGIFVDQINGGPAERENNARQLRILEGQEQARVDRIQQDETLSCRSAFAAADALATSKLQVRKAQMDIFENQVLIDAITEEGDTEAILAQAEVLERQIAAQMAEVIAVGAARQSAVEACAGPNPPEPPVVVPLTDLGGQP